VHDVAVRAFKSKSGDPTRALYCYSTGTSSGSYNIGRSTDVYCNVVSRSGTGITYLNSQRTAGGEASAGVSKEVAFAPFDGTMRPNELTIDTTDEYNAVVCVSMRDTNELVSERCPSPVTSSNCGNGANEVRWPNRIDGYLQCRHVWIEGWGSSTYNSDVFNGVASASGPVNVGSVQKIGLGGIGPRLRPPLTSIYPSDEVGYGWGYALTALSGYTGGRAPHPNHVQKLAICFTVSARNAPGCAVMELEPVNDVWQFNAPVDCVNGYGCLADKSRRLRSGEVASSANSTAATTTAA